MLEQIFALTPNEFPHLAIQALAAPASGATVAMLTNPLDLFRSNLQVKIIIRFRWLMLIVF